MNFYTAAILLMFSISIHAGGFPLKEEQSIYSEEVRQRAMQRVEASPLGGSQKAEVLRQADRWRDFSDEELIALVPPPQLPRSVYVHADGSPTIGKKVYDHGTYPWKTSLEQPWKVTCPETGEVFPSNDFGAFLNSGMKDRSLLTGDYPDDGWGWQGAGKDGRHHWFVAYYVTWELIMNQLMPALNSLPEAYLLTGDERYARQAALLLWKLSEYYPGYDYQVQSQYGKEVAPNTYKGKLLYHTWEALYTVPACAKAYDAIWPYLEKKGDELKETTGLASAQLREQIERQLLHEMLRLIIQPEPWIAGNYGMHQRAAILLMKTLNPGVERPSISEARKWLLENPDPANYTGMGVEDAMYNIIYRDGLPIENFGYNLGWLDKLGGIAGELPALGVDLPEMPRFQAMWRWPHLITALDRYTQAMGDGSDYRALAINRSATRLRQEMELFPNPEAASLLLKSGPAARPRSKAMSAGELLFFGASLETSEIEALAAKHPEAGESRSAILPAYGYALLQRRHKTGGRAVALSWGNPFGHGHADQLNIEIFSDAGAWIPDLGYPETANADDPRRFGYFNHTVSHNTVMVDQTKQSRQQPGVIRAYDDGEGVQMVRAEGRAYDGASEYVRSVYLIDQEQAPSLIIDTYRVRGGKQHDWLLHFVPGELQKPGAWKASGGTLAGENVAYGEFYDAAPSLVAGRRYGDYKGSGFQFLKEAERKQGANRAETVVAVYRLQHPAFPENNPASDEELRVYCIELPGTDVFHAKGELQSRFRHLGLELDYLIRRHRASESLFVTVYEVAPRETPLLKITPEIDTLSGRIALEVVSSLGEKVAFYESGKRQQTWKGHGIRWAGDAAIVQWDAAGKRKRVWSQGSRFDGKDGFAALPPSRYKVSAVSLEPPALQLSEGSPAGASTVIVGNARYQSLFFGKSDGERFALAGQDLRTGRVTPSSIDGARLQVRQFPMTAAAGMSLLSANGDFLGRIEHLDIAGRRLIIDRAVDRSYIDQPLWISAVGPGDQLWLATGERFTETP